MAVLWKADYTQATNVAAGYQASGSQRQNGAGQFNDTTVPWPITIAAGPAAMGRAIPFTIPDNYRRYEQVPTHRTFVPGDVYYFGWSFYLEPSFPLEVGIDYQVIEQIHQAWNSWSPPVAFEAMNNALYLTGGNGLIRSVSATDPLNTWSHFQKLLDIQTGRRYDVVYLIDAFSAQPNTSTISVWVNGVQVLNQYVLPCPTIVQGDAANNESYRKTGFYHRETIHGGTIWHGGASLATTYAEAAPTPALVETFADDFTTSPLSTARWTASAGVGVTAQQLSIPCQVVGGAPQFLSARSVNLFQWQGSSLTFKVPQMPAAGGGAGFAQMWLMDPTPAATVDRLGFELRSATGALDLIGQTGAGYAPIGTTTTVTYSPTTHAWLRLRHTGTSIVWDTSPDGVTWTLGARTLATPPAWTLEPVRVSFEAYRTSGVNDVFLVDNVNVPPAAAPSGGSGLAFYPFFVA